MSDIIEEVKERLGTGEKVTLELEDREGFRVALPLFFECLKGNDVILMARSATGTGSYTKLEGLLRDKYLKYFRIKRPSPTFDDLIDLAADAIKKKLIVNLYIGPHYIEFDSNGHSHAYDMQEAKRGIDFINSLYTETFVMEDVSSFLKITEGIQSIVLANGCDITHRVYFDDSSLRFRDDWGDSITLTFDILKGATVTQKRSN